MYFSLVWKNLYCFCFIWWFLYLYYVFIFLRVFLNDVIKWNNNLDIVYRGKKINLIYNIKCILFIWIVKKYVNFCKVWIEMYKLWF